MDYLDQIEQFLSKETLSPEDKAEMLFLLKKSKKEKRKLSFSVDRLEFDKTLIEKFLNTTIEELEAATEQLKNLQKVQLEEKEKTIRIKESQLQQITDMMPMSLSYVDKDYIYRIVNKPYEKWFGLKEKDILGKHIREIIGEEAFKVNGPMMESTWEGKSISFEHKMKDKDGNNLILSVDYLPAYDGDENIIGTYVFANNVTKIRESEIAIEEKNVELESFIESNLQLENFAYLASHDLRSPLKNIISFTQLLSLSLGEKLNEKEKKYLDFINLGTRRMQSFIDDLLAYSVAKNKELVFTEVLINDLVEEIILDQSQLIKEKGANIRCENLPKSILGDFVLLKQVFLNLISNALKFVKKDQNPTIEVECISKKTEYLFKISDNGIGIPKDGQERIFGIFKRMHNRTEYEGTGIGLSICKDAVNKHGGKIWVESEEGIGSTFCFTIQKMKKQKKNISLDAKK